MIITLSGRAGGGKSTIGKALAEKLNYTYVGIGAIRRQVAESMGLSILQFDELGNTPENAQEFDLKYDDYQKNLDVQEKIVLDGWVAFYCQPKAFKVFLDVTEEVGAQRIFDNKRPTDSYVSVEEVLKKTIQRSQENKLRYQKLYGVDITDLKNFDAIVDTTGKEPQNVVNEIVELFTRFQEK